MVTMGMYGRLKMLTYAPADTDSELGGRAIVAQAIIYKIRPDHPEPIKIAKVAETIANGGIVIYPTDTVHAIGCDPHSKAAVGRVRALKQISNNKPLTLLCASLDDLSVYAHVDRAAYKLMRALTPGPYTFLLKATKEVPRLVFHPKRKVVGLRVPKHVICQQLIEHSGGLLVSASAKLPSGEDPYDREELFDALMDRVDAIVDDGSPLGAEPSTVLDLMTGDHEVVRVGAGMDELRAYMF